MIEISDKLRVLFWVVAALAGILSAAIGNVLAINIAYFFTRRGRKPNPRPARLWAVFYLSALISILLGAFAAFSPTSQKEPAPISEATATNPPTSLRLVPIEGKNLVVEVGNRVLTQSETIPPNETITVTYKILNNGAAPASIKSLTIGSRGPGVGCDNKNAEKWSAPDNPFATIENITLMPGEEYEYQASRSFYLDGEYFLEPILQGPNGDWGGIQPFSCVTFSVATPNTSTPTPTITATASQTPSPTASITPIPVPTTDPEIYRGFDKNCIDQKYWTVVSNQPPPTYKQNAKICLDLSANGVASQDEGLRFNASPLDYPLLGLFTEIPARSDVEIHFKLRIDEFKTWTTSVDSILIFGISDAEDTNFKHGEFLFHGLRGAYKTDDIIREVGSNKTSAVLQWTPNVAIGETYDIIFSIHGIDLTIYVNNKTLKYYPRSLSQFGNSKVFWIGYHLPVGNSSLKASITDFTIIEK